MHHEPPGLEGFAGEFDEASVVGEEQDFRRLFNLAEYAERGSQLPDIRDPSDVLALVFTVALASRANRAIDGTRSLAPRGFTWAWWSIRRTREDVSQKETEETVPVVDPSDSRRSNASPPVNPPFPPFPRRPRAVTAGDFHYIVAASAPDSPDAPRRRYLMQ
jgi:hypothetical protein